MLTAAVYAGVTREGIVNGLAKLPLPLLLPQAFPTVPCRSVSDEVTIGFKAGETLEYGIEKDDKDEEQHVEANNEDVDAVSDAGAGTDEDEGDGKGGSRDEDDTAVEFAVDVADENIDDDVDWDEQTDGVVICKPRAMDPEDVGCNLYGENLDCCWKSCC